MKKILIIEDEKDIVDIATMILEDEGYEVSSLDEFEGFEGKLNNSDADLVLLDLNLNGYSGEQICKYIKADPRLREMPVVLMSANRNIHEVKEKAGADGYICKPFDLVDFINIVKAHVDKKSYSLV